MMLYRNLPFLALLALADADMMIGGPSGTQGAGMVDPELMGTIYTTGLQALGKCEISLPAAMMGGPDDLMPGGAQSLEQAFKPFRDFAESVKKTCDASEEQTFRAALDSFKSCSHIDLLEYMEDLPSAMVGIMEDCLDMFVSIETSMVEQFQANPDLTSPDMSKLNMEFSQQCLDAYLGNNPVGNAHRAAMIHPPYDCFEQMSNKIPDCTLHVWPIPIVGGVLRKVSCFLGSITPIVEAMALSELRKMNACLPESYSDSRTCSDIRTGCIEQGSNLFLSTTIVKAFSGMPLSDEYTRVAQLNGLSSTIDKYDEFNKKCGGHAWEALVNETPAKQYRSSNTRGGNALPPAVPDPEVPMSTTTSQSSNSSPSSAGSSAGSFFGGLLAGLVMAGVAWGYMAKRKREERARSAYMNMDPTVSLELS